MHFEIEVKDLESISCIHCGNVFNNNQIIEFIDYKIHKSKGKSFTIPSYLCPNCCQSNLLMDFKIEKLENMEFSKNIGKMNEDNNHTGKSTDNQNKNFQKLHIIYLGQIKLSS